MQRPDKWDEISKSVFATPVPDDLPVADMRQWTLDNFAQVLRSAFDEGKKEGMREAMNNLRGRLQFTAEDFN
jgi:predicted alpha/beta hydrolase